MAAAPCTDAVIGAILSGWRYDISGLSPAMRTDYEDHLAGCEYCRSKERLHRTIDVLLISVSTLSIVAFLLATLVIHRIEGLIHLGAVRLQLSEFHRTSIDISLEAVAFAGLFFSALLWLLVAIATPLPGFLRSMLLRRARPSVRPKSTEERVAKDHA